MTVELTLVAIGLAELALAARTVAGSYSRYCEPYLAISAIYLVLTLTLSLLAKRLETPAHLRALTRRGRPCWSVVQMLHGGTDAGPRRGIGQGSHCPAP